MLNCCFFLNNNNAYTRAIFRIIINQPSMNPIYFKRQKNSFEEEFCLFFYFHYSVRANSSSPILLLFFCIFMRLILYIMHFYSFKAHKSTFKISTNIRSFNEKLPKKESKITLKNTEQKNKQ